MSNKILMQSIVNGTTQTYHDIKHKSYKKAKDGCNKESQSRTKVVPTKITNDECKNRGLQNLQCQKKLCLVLDLDHTLVHKKLVCELSPEKAKICLDNVADHKDDIFRWKTKEFDCLIKLRPFVRKFLEEANKLFEMYIYTMGSRDYALYVASLLDPKSIYFGSRIISNENCTTNGQKGLDVVPVDESGILIVDDTVRVWSRNLSNLIVIRKYDYFRSLSEESERAGSLSCALKFLQEVHNLYFGWDNMLDVRVLLRNMVFWMGQYASCESVPGKHGKENCLGLKCGLERAPGLIMNSHHIMLPKVRM